MARPEDAIFFRRVWGRVLRDPYYGALQAFYVAPARADWNDEQKAAYLQYTHSGLMSAFERGTTFYISDEIGALLERMMERMQDKRIFHFEEQDFQGTNGFIYLDWPFLVPNSTSKTGYQKVVALGWSDHLAGGPELETIRNVGKLVFSVVEAVSGAHPTTGYSPYVTRHRIGIEYGVRMDPKQAPIDTYMQDMGWMERETRAERALRKREEDEGITRIMLLLYAWAMFAQTEITANEKLYIPRVQQKGFTREGRPLPEIRVVSLRRYADDPTREPGETLVEWSHRWEVRGHMRQIRVHRNSTETRWVHVRKHIKGPANKPLLLRETVEAYVR